MCGEAPKPRGDWMERRTAVWRNGELHKATLRLRRRLACQNARLGGWRKSKLVGRNHTSCTATDHDPVVSANHHAAGPQKQVQKTPRAMLRSGLLAYQEHHPPSLPSESSMASVSIPSAALAGVAFRTPAGHGEEVGLEKPRIQGTASAGNLT